MSMFFWPSLMVDQDRAWKPRVDVYRSPRGWVLKLDLAGVEPCDIAVQVEGSRVRISGSRRDRFLKEGWRCHSMEISYSRFERTVELASPLDASSLEMECDQGMLLVHVGSRSGHE